MTGRAEWKDVRLAGRDQPQLASMAARFRISFPGKGCPGTFSRSQGGKRLNLFVCELRQRFVGRGGLEEEEKREERGPKRFDFKMEISGVGLVQ